MDVTLEQCSTKSVLDTLHWSRREGDSNISESYSAVIPDNIGAVISSTDPNLNDGQINLHRGGDIDRVKVYNKGQVSMIFQTERLIFDIADKMISSNKTTVDHYQTLDLWSQTYVGFITGSTVEIKWLNIHVKHISNVAHLLLQKDIKGQDGEKAKISRHAAAMGFLKG